MLIRFTTPAHLYDIQETLSVSAASTVYLAQRTNKNFPIKQPLVIKVFKQKKSLMPILQMESLLKARYSAHLVKVLSFENFQNHPALILEYIHGVNLKQLIQNSNLNKNETACLCSQILTGLQELKNNGLSHGDLSLSNILIDTTGHIYLTDYGLANYSENNIYSTQPFTAPELYEGAPVCFQSDLFSLGVLEKILIGQIKQQELNSLENKNFILNNDTLLDPQPHNRTTKTFNFSATALSSLSYKVRQTLFIKKCFDRSSKKKKSPILNKQLKLQNKLFKKFCLACFSAFNYKILFNALKTAATPSYYRPIYLSIVFFICVFITNPFVSYGNIPAKQHPSKILVRTQKWVHVEIAGHSGYSPINIPILVSSTYKVKWRSYNKKGVKYLHVKAGENIVLRDKDFF